MDNVSTEYLFIADFFTYKSNDKQANLSNDIFETTFQYGESFTRRLLERADLDGYGILLCIRILQSLEFELQHRKVPVMESYCNRINMLLWPRFQTIMDAHADNLRKLSGGRLHHQQGAQQDTLPSISAILSYAAPPTQLNSSAPHAVTQKFATFLNGILELSPDEKESEPVSTSLVRMRNEFEAFLTKISSKLSATAENHPSDSNIRERFLYNNYMLVYTIISDTEGKLAEREREHFRNLTDAYGVSV